MYNFASQLIGFDWKYNNSYTVYREVKVRHFELLTQFDKQSTNIICTFQSVREIFYI